MIYATAPTREITVNSQRDQFTGRGYIDESGGKEENLKNFIIPLTHT